MRRLLMQPPMDEKSVSRTSAVKGALRAPRSGRRPLTPDVRGRTPRAPLFLSEENLLFIFSS
jgi:hypothetical protein